MTRNKKIIQIFLIFIGLFLILITYFLYPKIDRDKLKGSVVQDEQDKITDKEEDSRFENVEYRGNEKYRGNENVEFLDNEHRRCREIDASHSVHVQK